ncbi:MAG: serpin family protein [Actinomycetota bacterium]
MAAVAVVGVLAACAASPEIDEYRAEVAYQQVGLGEAPALPQLLAANDELGLAMLRSGEGSNVVVSPFSAYVVLAMLAEGARGGTAESFDSALGAAGADRTAAVNALRGALLVHDGDPVVAAGDELPEEPLLHLADRVLLDDDLVPEQDFLEVLARAYDAGIETVDLGTEAAKPVLDEWVNRETGGLIPESAIVPKPSLRLVLQDAIVLAARWLVPFDPNSTFEEPFGTPDGPMQVETMHGTADGFWPVTDADGWTAVRLPYVDGFVADLVLPPDGVDPADADAATLAELWAGPAGASAGSVSVTVPVLDLEARPLDLTPSLTDVGLGELFDAPDLSGITTAASLFVDQAVQQARLMMNEEGTVAAAVTEIAVAESAAPLPAIEVRFDRPFLVRVAHADTDLTLFLAAVRVPGAE